MKILNDTALKSISGGKKEPELVPIGNSINSVDTETGAISQDMTKSSANDTTYQGGDGVFTLEHFVPGLNK
ncbi:MAG: bacteriocin [Alphaproteobacteria bacterium]|nr:bacteriocin [Alphaproteobacteria bacterium]